MVPSAGKSREHERTCCRQAAPGVAVPAGCACCGRLLPCTLAKGVHLGCPHTLKCVTQRQHLCMHKNMERVRVQYYKHMLRSACVTMTSVCF